MPDTEYFARRSLRSVDALSQSGPADCGLIALEMVLAFHGASNIRPALRQALGFSGMGTTVHALVSAARATGFDADAFTVSAPQLRELPLPAILHWRRGHYVVLEAVSGDGFSIVDPAVGRRQTSTAQLVQLFSGVVILVEPLSCAPTVTAGPTIEQVSLREATRRQDWLFLGALLALSSIALVLTAQQLLRLIDSWIGGSIDPASYWGLAGSCSIVLLTEIGLARLDFKVTSRVGEAIARSFADALQNAPPEYVTSRAERFLEYAASEADPLFNSEFPRPTRFVRAVVVPILVAFVAQTSISVAVAIVFVTIVQIIAESTRHLRGAVARGRSHLYAARELLRAIFSRPQDLLGAGVFGDALQQWLRVRERTAAAAASGESRWMLPLHEIGLVIGLSTLSVLVLVEYGRQQMSLAEAVAVQLVAIVAVVLVSGSLFELRRYRSWMVCFARVRDIQRERASTETRIGGTGQQSESTTAPLLECGGLSLGDSENEALWLREIDLMVRAGESIAIIGSSGAGKTLLMQAMTGIRRPSRGLVRLSGANIQSLEESERRERVVGILDDAVPMDGTVGGFLRSTSHADANDVRLACALVGLDERVFTLPMGLQTPISRGAAGFAAHERRLLCLARTLVIPPRVLVLDATLDGLDQQRAIVIATAVATRVDAIVLLTTRPEIVPSSFRRFYLDNGRLSENASSADSETLAGSLRVEDKTISEPDE